MKSIRSMHAITSSFRINEKYDSELKKIISGDTSIFLKWCFEHNTEFIDRFFETPDFDKLLSPYLILNGLRSGYFKDPSYSAYFEKHIAMLKSKFSSIASPSTQKGFIDKNTELGVALGFLFTSDFFSCDPVPEGKEVALKRALLYMFTTLTSPKLLAPYLYKLEHLLAAYIKLKGIQISEPKEYMFREVDRLLFPIPLDTYNKDKEVKKFSALQELLTLILQPSAVYRWVGFIDTDVANEHIRQGALVTEDVTLNQLFHGKLSHPIQLALMTLMFLEHKEWLCYQENGVMKTLNTKEIFSSLVTENVYHDAQDKTLWTRMFDMRVYSHFSFNDPYFLHSYIMQDKKSFPTLSSYMIGSFCKHFLRAKKDYEAYFRRGISNEDYANLMNDIILSDFITSPLYSFAEEYVSKSHRTSSASSSYALRRSYIPMEFDFKAELNSVEINPQEITIEEKRIHFNPTHSFFNNNPFLPVEHEYFFVRHMNGNSRVELMLAEIPDEIYSQIQQLANRHSNNCMLDGIQTNYLNDILSLEFRQKDAQKFIKQLLELFNDYKQNVPIFN